MLDDEFQHLRHKPARTLARPRELILACAPLRSNVNLSRIVRAAGCCGIGTLICCGNGKVIDKIARDGADAVQIRQHRTLLPQLRELKEQGYPLVGLEQTTGSKCLYGYPFARRLALVIGNERAGLEQDVLKLLDDVVEIPVYGLPYAHNVATATAMALYEYCRQYPDG